MPAMKKRLLNTVAISTTLTLATLAMPSVAAEFTLRIGLIAQVDQPIERGARLFKELVEAGSDGAIQVQIFPGGQLGGEIELQDSVALGAIQMASIGTPVTSGKLPKLDILNMYYLWESREHMANVLEGPIGQELFSEYEAATGIHVLAANWQQGTRKTILRRPATNPEEMRGIKIRVTAGVPIYDSLWSAMGASPVPLAFPDAYSAMQTGVVDGVELPPDFIFNNGFHDLGDYLIETDHYFYTNILIINRDFFDRLPDEWQELVRNAALEAGEYQTELVLQQESEIVDKIRATGTEVLAADIEAFRESVAPVFEAHMATWGEELYQRILAAAP